jgi:ribosome-associated heat shock protein Hsp15
MQRSGARTRALDRQRIDRWLWHARVVRTRSAAAALAVSGHVRINGQRIDVASRSVRLGDVVTVALDRTVRVLKVAAFAERRGPAESARVLAEDLMPASEPTPSPPAAAAAGVRQPGAGRPTKRDRRAIAHFRGEDEF